MLLNWEPAINKGGLLTWMHSIHYNEENLARSRIIAACFSQTDAVDPNVFISKIRRLIHNFMLRKTDGKCIFHNLKRTYSQQFGTAIMNPKSLY